jgi:hypothetical protein
VGGSGVKPGASSAHRRGDGWHRVAPSAGLELASTQESLINHDRLRKQLASLGAKVKVYKTATGTGARSESDSFDITV